MENKTMNEVLANDTDVTRNRNIVRKQLDKLIDGFLEERIKSSHGDWAPATQEHLNEMGEIVKRLIRLKFETDADGDFPVEGVFVNRTEGRLGYPAIIRYRHNMTTQDLVRESAAMASAARSYADEARICADLADERLRNEKGNTQNV